MLDVTPLSYAVEFATFEIIKLLFNQGGSIERGQLLHYGAYRKSPDQAEALAYLVEKGLNVNHMMYQNRMDNYNMQKDWSLGTLLHRAAERGRLIGAKWLVEHGGTYASETLLVSFHLIGRRLGAGQMLQSTCDPLLKSLQNLMYNGRMAVGERLGHQSRTM
jgi:ankyrin repeat protein